MSTKDNTPIPKWEKYAGPKKPSMKRRLEGHDYLGRGIYMVTIAIEGRRPLLGTLAGNPTVEEGADSPHVILSPLGEKIKECWFNIPQFYPQIEVIKLCIMPDHIHGILFVHESIERHLGHVINGFKIGTRKAARALGLITTALPQLTQPQTGTSSSVMCTAAPPQSSSPSHPVHGQLWEPNYNDRILHGKGQYARMLTYLDDNPRRLLIKRHHPNFFTNLGTIQVAGLPMQAMGNRFLLDNPVKLQIQCSRRLTQEEIEERKDSVLQIAQKEGAILVSPCISQGEQQIATAAMQADIPLIVLLLKGFPPYFKPQPRYIQACSEGRLLMISPFPYQNEKIDNMRQRCLQLNAIAKSICE